MTTFGVKLCNIVQIRCHQKPPQHKCGHLMCIENRISVLIDPPVSNINIQKICYYVITGYHGNLLLARLESAYSLIWSGGVRVVGKFSIWKGVMES